MKYHLSWILYGLAFFGWMSWLFLSYQIGSWWMAVASFVPGLNIATWIIGFWSLFFGMPEFVYRIFG